MSSLTESAQDLLSNVGGAFIGLRQEAGLTQRQAAKLANSTQARISDLENGKGDPALSTILRWAQVYGYEVELSFVPVEDEAISDDDILNLLTEIEEEEKWIENK